jgi:hypothetical protein
MSLCGTMLNFMLKNSFSCTNSEFFDLPGFCQLKRFSDRFKTYQSIGGATMKNQKSLAIIVATVMLFSFAAVPQANAFIGLAALGAIIAATFTSAVLVNETVVKSDNKTIPEHAALKQKKQDKLQALSEP